MLRDCSLACCAGLVAVALNLLAGMFVPQFLPNTGIAVVDEMKAMLGSHDKQRLSSSLLVFLLVVCKLSVDVVII